MQRLAIAKANHYADMTLDSEEIDTVAEAFRLRALANGLGVLYDTYFVNPTFSRKQAEIRAGFDVCRWCQMARTPSNAHLHTECDKWLELAS
ncbi:MAG TPA: hypothetical protein VFK04_13115 [Gemmatimonadaceae bacterium]|nr:hypothetical protein [Gemmatimonadaceae bacterium]